MSTYFSITFVCDSNFIASQARRKAATVAIIACADADVMFFRVLLTE